jgi:cytochrome c biogenesis protein CcmG/thiol:disulfide interchange protein DsbE
MSRLRLMLPLLLLALLAALLYKGMQYDPRALPSARVGKAAPAIALAALDGARFDSGAMQGKVWILNVFASWCTACVTEHAALVRLRQRDGVTLVGLAYKDDPADTRAWLQRLGDPYQHIALDTLGRTGIEYGVYGVPETFVVDARGTIVYRHVGPIGDDFYERHVAPLLGTAAGPAK